MKYGAQDVEYEAAAWLSEKEQARAGERQEVVSLYNALFVILHGEAEQDKKHKKKYEVTLKFIEEVLKNCKPADKHKQALDEAEHKEKDKIMFERQGNA